MEKVKKAMGPIPGGSEKDRGDRDRAPVVFGTVIVDSNNNFRKLTIEVSTQGTPYHEILSDWHAFEQNGFVGLSIHGYCNPKGIRD